MPGDDCLATLVPAKSSGDPASSLGVYERYNKVDTVLISIPYNLTLSLEYRKAWLGGCGGNGGSVGSQN